MKNWHLAQGYRFSGVHSGIRSDPGRLDLALVVSDRPARAAGAFTQNRVQAAPVHACKERLPSSQCRGIVICSGNANACTGAQGLRDARRMTECAASALGVAAEQFLVCSTGVIGHFLPMDKVEPGIATAADELGSDADYLERAARAILTTDTGIKVRTREFSAAGKPVRITGFAKGAAMIGPNMATMLAFVLTDADIEASELAALVPELAEKSFNSISVEGHTSTNDSLIVLANGAAGTLDPADRARFKQEALNVCQELARDIASDAEGAEHIVTIEVEGSRSDREARQIAKVVAESALVKTAIFGADPNWGRIVSAAGYAGVDFAETNLSLWLGDFLLYKEGVPQRYDARAASEYLRKNRDVSMRLLFNLGPGRCTFYTCDLTYEYIRLNAEYTT